MRQQQIILMTVVMFMFLIFIAAGGYYYTTTLEEEEKTEIKTEKKTGSCVGMDLNAKYEYDNEGKCVFKECAEGYFQQSGWCVKPVDVYKEIKAVGTGPPIDCQIRSYTWGDCISDTSGEPLTGLPGACGSGKQKGTALDYDPQQNGGTCEDFETERVCEVPCPAECKATDSNYTIDGSCMADGKELGDEYCGTGVQSMRLDPSTVTDFADDTLRDNWIAVNWESCQPTKSMPCEVECVAGKTRHDCPNLDDSVQKSYVVDGDNKPICFKPEYAQKVISGEAVLDRSNPDNVMASVTADDMWNDVKGEYNQPPMGKKISYRTGGGMSYEDMVLSGCVNYELEDCIAPQIPAPCEMELGGETLQTCGLIGDTFCGPYKEIVKNSVTRPAFASGSCSVEGTVVERGCDINGMSAKNCCDENIDGNEWVEQTGDKNCDKITDKRKWTRKDPHPGCNVTEKWVQDTTCEAVNCQWNGNWYNHGPCNKSTGKQAQKRNTTPAKLGGTCSLDGNRSVDCRVNCEGGRWSDSECSVPCGGGTLTRTWVDPTYTPKNNGSACPATHSADCNTQACPAEEGRAVKCATNDPRGDTGSVYRYTNYQLRWYPNPRIANSWERGWKDNMKLIPNCAGITHGPDMAQKPTSGAPHAQPSRGIGFGSDRRLKDDIKKIGEYEGLNVYIWRWNEVAMTTYGYKGMQVGFMSDELDREYIGVDVYGYDFIKEGTKISEALENVRKQFLPP